MKDNFPLKLSFWIDSSLFDESVDKRGVVLYCKVQARIFILKCIVTVRRRCEKCLNTNFLEKFRIILNEHLEQPNLTHPLYLISTTCFPCSKNRKVTRGGFKNPYHSTCNLLCSRVIAGCTTNKIEKLCLFSWLKNFHTIFLNPVCSLFTYPSPRVAKFENTF